ncbi:MAG TPA: SDR family oxidoreductase [Chitinophagaceae bacterium]|jgi:NAD(P)-dependent dehydrogenase (short-subunit alcohol dehydrogenase family)|nr:SDR family oxidoreductase [Chitinophagaceae bacterium]
MGKLNGKTAVITGGNSGIGFATAKLFLQEGANVIITGRNEKAVNDAVKELGKGASGIISDAGNMNDINTLKEKVEAITSTVDILFANAGIALFVPFAETSESIFDQQININFKGAFFTVQRLLPLIPEGGSVIFTSSIVAHIGLEASTAYSASKSAVLSLSKTLASELASRQIRVNSISPGPINTPIFAKTGMPEEATKEFGAAIQAKLPLKRFGIPEEVANVALFLASTDSNFVTGAELTVDGGARVAF